jgi:hypothetical protein
VVLFSGTHHELGVGRQNHALLCIAGHNISIILKKLRKMLILKWLFSRSIIYAIQQYSFLSLHLIILLLLHNARQLSQ